MRIARMRRLAIPLLLLGGVAFGISAKCIENDSLRIGRDGNWHIYGEIHNETDVQGLDIRVLGTAFDSSGAEIAVAQATMCPSSLSPGTFSVYDVELSIPPGGQQPVAHKVNVAGGTASAEPLPALEGTYGPGLLFLAKRPMTGVGSILDGSFELATPISNGPIVRGDPNLPIFMYCIAGYNSNGDLVEVLPPRRARVAGNTTIDLDSPKGPPPNQLPVPEPISPDVVSFRLLLWRASPDGRPMTAVAISDMRPAIRPGPGDEGEF